MIKRLVVTVCLLHRTGVKRYVYLYSITTTTTTATTLLPHKTQLPSSSTPT